MSAGRVAVVLMAYGTPRSRDDIAAYYTDIRRGHPPSEQQLAELTARYEAIAPRSGGELSPLAQRTEAQRSALQAALDQLAPQRFDVVLGLKHAAPTIEDAVADVASARIERIVGLVLAPHYSAFSIGTYLDRLRAAAAPHGIAVDGIDSWATEPAFITFLANDLRSRLQTMPADTKVLFTAHSLPQRIIDTGDPYPHELSATAEAVAAALGLRACSQWAIAWQSAGRTPEPWLGPDVLQVIDDLASSGHGSDEHADHPTGVVVCACGFVADHLEVLYDLDIEAAQRARACGLAFARTACVNDDPSVMGALAARVLAAS